jgi:hypothetical protein
MHRILGYPGDLVRIIPRSDPGNIADNFYEGRVIEVYVQAPNRGPLAVRIKPTRPEGNTMPSVTIPWDAIEALAVLEPADLSTNTPEENTP